MNLHSTQRWGRASLVAAGVAMALVNMTAANAQTRRITLPAGTVIPVKLDQTLNSKDNDPGDRFTATVKYGRDDAGLPEGTRIEGVVREALRSENDKPGVIDLDIRRIIPPDGDARTIQASLYSLDSKSVKHDDSGRLVATSNNSNDKMKWVGIGAGAGLLIGTLMKGNTLVDTLLGAGAGYLFGELQGKKKAGDVSLKAGTEFGVRLDRPLTISVDERSYRSTDPLYRDDRLRNDPNYRLDPDYRNDPRYRNDPDYRDTPNDRNYRRDDRYYNPDRTDTRVNDPNYRYDRNDPYRYDRYRDRAGDIAVMVDDRSVTFNSSNRPFMRNNIVYVPLEAVARRANVDYRWDPDNGVLTARNGRIRFTENSRYATVNGVRRNMEGMIEVRNGVVFVPMQFVGYMTNGTATYDSNSRTVEITTNR